MSGALADEAFARLAASEDSNFWFRARNELLLGVLRREFPSAGSFLDVGCGNGYVLGAVAAQNPSLRVTGTDPSAAALGTASARAPGATLVETVAGELAFDGEFDVVGAFDVIEHIDDDAAALAAIARAVRPGGGVMITVPQHRWLWSETDRFSGHHRRYVRSELNRKLSEAGLRLRFTTSFVTLLLPFMAASRLWEAVAPRAYDPARELRLTGRMNSAFERAILLEVWAIGHGARLPVGGSLLAVAERPV